RGRALDLLRLHRPARRPAESQLLRRDQRPDLLQPLLADPLDPLQVVHRAIGPALDDPPGDHLPDGRASTRRRSGWRSMAIRRTPSATSWRTPRPRAPRPDPRTSIPGTRPGPPRRSWAPWSPSRPIPRPGTIRGTSDDESLPEHRGAVPIGPEP